MINQKAAPFRRRARSTREASSRSSSLPGLDRFIGPHRGAPCSKARHGSLAVCGNRILADQASAIPATTIRIGDLCRERLAPSLGMHAAREGCSTSVGPSTMSHDEDRLWEVRDPVDAVRGHSNSLGDDHRHATRQVDARYQVKNHPRSQFACLAIHDRQRVPFAPIGRVSYPDRVSSSVPQRDPRLAKFSVFIRCSSPMRTPGRMAPSRRSSEERHAVSIARIAAEGLPTHPVRNRGATYRATTPGISKFSASPHARQRLFQVACPRLERGPLTMKGGSPGNSPPCRMSSAQTAAAMAFSLTPSVAVSMATCIAREVIRPANRISPFPRPI